MKKTIHFFGSLAILMLSMAANAQRITVTVAGNGVSGNFGDNGPAKKAALNAPNYICMGPGHDLYFADQTNTRIRKVTAKTGVITTIAGAGTSTADLVPAISASLTTTGLCADAIGNVYYVSSPDKIRKIDAATGIVTTIAGGGSSTADGVPAVSSSLSSPSGLKGVCIDPTGNLYILVGHKIRKVAAGTGIITTVAGTGTAGNTGNGGPATAAMINNPQYIAADPWGNLYFGDQGGGDLIRRVDGTTGIITAVIGGGSTLFGCSGTSCYIGGLSGLCCDGEGNVIFNEYSCSCRKWDRAANWVTNVGGNFYTESFRNDTVSDYAWMNHNYGICADDANNYFIGDMANDRIRKIMLLTHTPSFSFGEAQYVTLCPGSSAMLDSMLWMTDMDATDVETWSVIDGPANGSVSGFPHSAYSNGTIKTTKPTGLSYTPAPAFSGPDSFRVQVTDGVLSDTIMIVVQVSPTVLLAGTNDICTGTSAPIVATLAGGTWSVSNSNATVTSAGSVSGVSLGTVYVSYTVNNGCGLVTTRKLLNVIVPPAVGVVTGADTVCQGSSTLMTASVPGGTWSSTTVSFVTIDPLSGMATGVGNGSVNIRYTISNTGCAAVASKSLRSYAPNVGIISGPVNVCVTGATVTLTNSIAGGVWSATNPRVTINPVSGLVAGVSTGLDTIRYMVTGSLGCTATASRTINVSPAVVPSAGVITGGTSVCTASILYLSETVSGGVWSVSNTNATISAFGDLTGLVAGTDSVLYTVDNGCFTNSAFKIITVNALPDAGELSGPTVLCEGTSIDLASSVTGGIWSATNPVATVSATGTVYAVTGGTDTMLYTVTNMCGSTTASRIISVETAPDPGAITGLSELCKNSTTTLTTSGASGGVWLSLNANATIDAVTGNVTGVSAGPATIRYKVMNECGERMTDLSITVKECGPLTELPVISTSAPEVRVFPNPAKNVLNVSVRLLQGETAMLNINDVTGRILVTQSIFATSSKIDISALAPGVYFVTIIGEGVNYIEKIVVTS